MPIKVVFFDMGDTLTTILPSWAGLYVAVARGAGIALDEAAVATAYAEVFATLGGDEARLTYEASAEADERYYKEINGEVLRRAGAPAAMLDRLLADQHREFDNPAHFHVFPDAVPTLRALQNAGYRLGIISNWSWNLPDLCDGLGLTPYFAHIVTSARVGASKPHRAIFAYALDRFDVAPHEAVQIGDSISADIAGAEAVGMRGILLDRNGTPASSVRYHIRTLADIPALLATLP